MRPPASPSRCAARKKRTTTATFPSPICRRVVVDAARVDAHPRGDARAARRAPPAASSTAYGLPEYDAAQLTQSRAARRLSSSGRSRAGARAEGGQQLDDGRAGARAERARARHRGVAGRAGAARRPARAHRRRARSAARSPRTCSRRCSPPGATADEIVARRRADADRRRGADRRRSIADGARAATPTPSRSTARGKTPTFGFLVGQVMKATAARRIRSG